MKTVSFPNYLDCEQKTADLIMQYHHDGWWTILTNQYFWKGDVPYNPVADVYYITDLGQCMSMVKLRRRSIKPYTVYFMTNKSVELMCE